VFRPVSLPRPISPSYHQGDHAVALRNGATTKPKNVRLPRLFCAAAKKPTMHELVYARESNRSSVVAATREYGGPWKVLHSCTSLDSFGATMTAGFRHDDNDHSTAFPDAVWHALLLGVLLLCCYCRPLGGTACPPTTGGPHFAPDIGTSRVGVYCSLPSCSCAMIRCSTGPMTRPSLCTIHSGRPRFRLFVSQHNNPSATLIERPYRRFLFPDSGRPTGFFPLCAVVTDHDDQHYNRNAVTIPAAWKVLFLGRLDGPAFRWRAPFSCSCCCCCRPWSQRDGGVHGKYWPTAAAHTATLRPRRRECTVKVIQSMSTAIHQRNHPILRRSTALLLGS
jgi:hypothetical protein